MRELLNELVEVNATLRKDNGMYVASNGTHYRNFSWIRDIYYQAKPSLKLDRDGYKQTYDTLTEYILGLDGKYDNKLQWLIDEPTINSSCFIHPRFHHGSLTEITSHWGNVQLDVFGYYILAIAEAMEEGVDIEGGVTAVGKMIQVLDSIKYWEVCDNAIWEENAEVHASSVGAVVGALEAYLTICPWMANDMMIGKLIRRGKMTLKKLLPRESVTKRVDLALLTLVYPFNVLDVDMAKTIIKNVTNHLQRDMGVIRYYGDAYYNNSPHAPFEGRVGEECEWCMGFAFLAHAHKLLGNCDIAEEYFKKMKEIHELNSNDGLPEGYYGGTKDVNDNSRLGWPTGMMIDYINEYKL